MSDTLAQLRARIGGGQDLQSLVRTMKALAASSIAQYEHSVRALADYDRTVQLGLGACLRQVESAALLAQPAAEPGPIGAVVFGSDQGLVGQFNDAIAAHALARLAALPGRAQVWAVGERVQERLADAGLATAGLLPVPGSVSAISALVGQILLQTETLRGRGRTAELHLFYNRPAAGGIYTPVSQRLLPLDAAWCRQRMALPWPTRNPPETLGAGTRTLEGLLGEYLFVSLFRACAESLASENGSRLAAMQRADRRIDELLTGMQSDYHRLRQGSIDEELFDVIAGFEAVS